MGIYHFSLRKRLCIILWSHNLLHLAINNIFRNLPKPKITWVNCPVIRSFFLLSRIIILMRFQIHLSNLFGLWHIFTRINGFLNIVFIFLCWNSIFKFLIFRLWWHIVITSNSLSERLPKNKSIFTFYVICICFRKPR